jgi:hypothetical protein
MRTTMIKRKHVTRLGAACETVRGVHFEMLLLPCFFDRWLAYRVGHPVNISSVGTTMISIRWAWTR